MRRFTLGVCALIVVFAAAMSFATLSVYDEDWWWGVVTGGIMVIFLSGAGLLVQVGLRSYVGGELRAAKVGLQMLGSICGLLFFIMAMITWALGRRAIGDNNAYTTLGLLIFLGFAGVGLQGAFAMIGYYVHANNQFVVVPAREAALEHAEVAHPAH